jgi:ATP-dependent RNA helicase SUPV3L1/SUV3
MGLNMSVDHVAFAQRRKFDGRAMRDLAPAELAQIAGRAGRHMNDGTFGVTAGLEPFEPELVEMVENHRFDPVRQLQWRNAELDFRTVEALLRSLGAPPPRHGLMRTREAVDQLALRALGDDPELAPFAVAPAAVKRLWEVCQIPDFRKASADSHHRLLKRIYLHLMSAEGVLPVDWVAEQVSRLDRTDGDIDTLSNRIAHVRTWAYVSHRADWMADARHWRERAREIEDRLSDALHEALTQRFVDRRTAALVRGLRSGRELVSSVTSEGDVLVEGQFVGRLQGLRFKADAAEAGSDARAMRTAANRVLAHETAKRADALAEAADDEIEWRDDNRLWWGGAPVAGLAPGPDMLRPTVQVLPTEHLSGPQRERVRRRLAGWLDERIAACFAPLLRLREAPLSGPARGLAYQLAEAMGSLPRPPLEPLIQALEPADRKTLRRHGVRLGYLDVFAPATLKPAVRAMRARLWAVAREEPAREPPPAEAVAVAVPREQRSFLQACGFRPAGPLAVRIDVLDRLVGLARKAAEAGEGVFRPDAAMASLLGRSGEELAATLQAAGFRREGDEFRLPQKPARGRRARRPRDGAFAGLARLKAARA